MKNLIIKLQRWLAPPIFPNDENKTLVARALHFVTLWTFATIVVIGLNTLLFTNEDLSDLALIPVGLGVAGMSYWQMRRGQVRRASLIFVCFGWAIVTVFVFLSGGLETIASSLYVTIIVMAALFLGWRAGVVAVGLTLATMLGMALAVRAGYPLPHLFPLSGMTNWLLLAHILTLVLIMVISVERGLRQALGFAREQLGEREKAEEALRESEERFRLISSVMSDYTFSARLMAHGELDYLMLTGAFEAIIGYTPDEFRQMGGWQAVVHPDDLAHGERVVATVIQNQRAVIEVRMIRKDGQIRWLRLYINPVWDAEQGRVTAINGAGQDITERKLAEEALRESEERFRLISSMTSDCTFSTSLNRQGELEYLMITGAFEAITGYAEDEFRQMGGWLALLHPDDLMQNARDMATLVENRRVVADVRIIRKDGQTRWVRMYADPVWDAEQERVVRINGAGQDITEQKLAEEALQESEERFRLISSVMSDYTFSSRLNAPGSLEHTMLTGAFEAITGYTPEAYAAVGGWRAILHPDDLAQDDRDMAALHQNQRVVTEVRIIKKGGEVCWVRVYAHPVWDAEQARLIGINGAVQDITERKLAEEALRQSEKRLRALQDATTNITFLMALDGTLLTVNKQFAELEGKTIEAMIGRNGFDIFNPDVRHARQQYFDKVVETKQPLRWVDFTQSVWRDNSLYPVLSADGSVEAFAVYSQDITAQKRLEAEVAQYTERLEEMVVERTGELSQAKDQIELILNNSTDAVALAQADGDIQTANPAYYTLLGAQASQSIERMLGIVPNESHVTAISEALLRVIHQGESQRLEVQIVAPDGRECDIDLALIPVRLRQDDPRCGILVSARNITNLKEMERFKARFVSNAIHDLGNPIQGLMLRIQALKMAPQRLEEHTKALNNQIEHFRDILEDLRTLSHLDQQQLILKLAASNLNEMAQRVFDTYEPVALNKQQTLKFSPAPHLPEVWVDIRQLERVMVNLVTNAINYTPEGKQIEVCTKLDGDEVAITVKDQGIGMDSKDAARVFERFYRTATARKANTQGTGLGLAIVKEIVDLHGGSVTVKSKPGQGSTFTVRLPMQR
jgi:PAS domain S-box-containing protein